MSINNLMGGGTSLLLKKWFMMGNRGEDLPEAGHIIWTRNVSSVGSVRVLSSTANISKIFVNGASRSISYNQSLAAGKNTIEIVLSNTNTVPDIFRNYISGCEVWVSDSFTRYADYAFYSSQIGSIHWNPENMISAGNSAFYNSNIKFGEARFPNLTSLGNGVFNGRPISKVLDLGQLSVIPQEAFRSTGCTYFVLPATLTQINNLAFYINNNNIDYKILATTPPILNGTQVFNRAPRSIQVPSVSVQAYKSASGWSAYASKISAIPE